MKKAVTILLLSGWSGCSGDPSGDVGKDTDSPADTGQPSTELPTIYVNELVTSNATGLTDEVGAHPDWFELFNPNDEEVDLSGWWITEDANDVFEWQIPADTRIEARGYLVVFADNDPEEGGLHASFKLAGAGGDDLVIYGPNELGNPLVDAIEDMQAIPTDVALARIPDGGPTWDIANSPTPGAAND